MITSASNQKMKNLMALCQKSKERRAQQSFIVEGSKMFLEAPQAWIKEVYVSESFWAKCSFKDCLKTTGYEIVSDDVFKRVADTRTPQGILSVLKTPHYELEQLLDEKTFVRISKSEIINLHFVRRLDLGITGTIGMQLKNGETAYVSRRYVNHIKSILGL